MTDLSTRNDFCVYIHTSPSGKSYVGQTCGNPKRRWNNGWGYRCNKYFWAAIQKYGWKSFEHSIVAKNLNQDQANFLEKQFIRFLASDDRRFGYNIQEGGRSAGGMSPEGYAHMMEWKRNHPAPNARAVCIFDTDGKRIDAFENIAIAARAYGVTPHAAVDHLTKGRGTCGGVIFRYADDVGETLQLPTNEVFKPQEKPSIRGASNYRARAVNVYEPDGTFIQQFPTIVEAAAFLGVSPSSVNESLLRGCGTTGKKLVRYSNGVDDCADLEIDTPIVYMARPSKRKPVCQYDLDGKFLSAHESITSAAEKTGIELSAISSCLRNNSHHSGGFQWRYDTGDHSDIERAKTKTEVRNEHRAYPYKPVWRLDPVTHERLERYESIRAAGRAIGVDKANIQAVIKGKKKTCRGYGWEYDV